MNLLSTEQLGVDPRKLAAVGAAAALAAGVVFQLAVGGVLGTASIEVEVVVAVIAFYVVVSAPKRMMNAAAMSQARDALPLSVMERACLSVTGSRARTLLLLSSRDAGISRALTLAKRKTLLGWGVRDSLEDAASGLASYSASNVVKGLAGLSPASIREQGEENEGLSSSARLAGETKLPVYMALCFFTPIMLLLYSLFSGITSPGSLAELVALEVLMLDLGFYLCSSQRQA